MNPYNVERDGETKGQSIDTNACHNWIVGKCLECKAYFDEISGSRSCTVCRDLVLICEKCQSNLREYLFSRHST